MDDSNFGDNMTDTVKVKSRDIMLLFTHIKLLEAKIEELTKHQQQMSATIENLTQPRKTIWTSITKYLQWGQRH